MQSASNANLGFIDNNNAAVPMGAVIAKRMGLPIERIVVATNASFAARSHQPGTNARTSSRRTA